MRRIALLLVLVMAGCVASLPPAPTRPPTAVAASFGATWNAVIDVFADRNIPIATIDRASGFIATEPLQVDGLDGEKWAVCATSIGMVIPARTATYNVLVRGDSTAATVRATVTWQNASASCVTKGTYESELETVVRALAEAVTQ